MASVRWDPFNPPFSYPAGAVLFDITLPGEQFRSYHAMLVRLDSSHTLRDGLVKMPVSDMTNDGLRWPEDDHWHTMHPDCFIAWFPELDVEETHEVIEELHRLRLDPRITDRDYYTLARHGVWKEDPNAPGNVTPGIACSCASLVEHCYESIADPVDLVGSDQVPLVSAKELWDKVGIGEYRPGVGKVLERLGLKAESNDPQPPRWPVLLPAYQMRAFDRSLSELESYVPELDHHPYP